jgi:hypothetical protein
MIDVGTLITIVNIAPFPGYRTQKLGRLNGHLDNVPINVVLSVDILGRM